MENVLAQPYYGDKKIRFYHTANPVAASPLYTLDIASDINSNWGAGFGPNSVAVHHTKIFVAIANDNGDKGGVLMYNYADVYPAKSAVPPAVLKFGLPNGLSAAGIAINPANGDLYVPTFHVSGSDGGVYMYTAASNYTALSHFSDFNDNSVAEICANLAFDAKGNLWMTTWSPDNDPSHHFLICYKGLSKSNFYKIINTNTKSYTATNVGGSTINVHLLSAPEGIAFDPAGNAWLGNNNDFAKTNNAGEGTLVKINASWITSVLAGSSAGPNGDHTFTVPNTEADIKYIPSGKPGGLVFTGTTLYINDQGQNEGAGFASNGTVWQWDVNTAFNSANFTPSGIHTTYPGNGAGAFLDPFIYMADNLADNGAEPNNTITQPWQSLDIWVRKAADGKVSGNDNTEDVTGGQKGFVYVNIHNKGMLASRGTEIIKLYWAKASAGLFWPAPWDGSINDAGTGKPLGGFIAQETLPSIPAGGVYIADFGAAGWPTPNPSEYTNTDGHFCLLARVESKSVYPFGMTFPEINNQIVKNALNNNTIAWRNIHIVNPVNNKIKIGGGIIAANYTAAAMKTQISFELLNADGTFMDAGNAQLLVTAKGAALEKLNQTAYDRNAVESLGDGVFKITDNKSGIENILLQPGEMLQLQASYDTDENLAGAALRVIQNEQDGSAKRLVGGQTFVYGKVKGLYRPSKHGHKAHYLLWPLVGIIIAVVTCILRWKAKKRNQNRIDWE